jgi:hypothetical protein
MMWRRLGQHLIRTYLAFDPRSLGLFRILLGLALLIDLHFRFRGIDYWYTDEGILPTRLVRDAGLPYQFSLFLHASTRAQAALGMAACAITYVLFTIGLWTRLFHVLSFLAVISLNGRVFMLENAGHSVLTLLVLWSLFLPLGRRFSIDALRAARAGRRRGETPRPDERPVVSLAVLALLLQFALIYLLNVVQKVGPAWWDGSAVHYVLHDERMNTAFAVWLREHLPAVALRALTWATLALEAAAPILILSPFRSRQLRLAAVVLLPALHAGFALCLTLGVFSFAMISFYALLLAPEGGHSSFPRSARKRGMSPIWLREGLVVVVAGACLGDLAISNPAWPERLRFPQPALFHAIIWYPRIRQYWIMFTPEPARRVMGLAVEARTAGGRLVDPYNEVASRYPALPRAGDGRGIPVRLGQDQPFSDYTLRMPRDEHAWCRSAFVDWILAYPRRTGDPRDRIESFTVYVLATDMPPPGSSVQGRTRHWRVLSYP